MTIERQRSRHSILVVVALGMMACTGKSGTGAAPVASGTALVYAGSFKDDAELARSMDVIRKRIELYYDEHGDKGVFGRSRPAFVVSTPAKDKVRVEVGDRDSTRLAGLKQILRRSGRLEFKLLASDQDPVQVERIREMKEAGVYETEKERFDTAHEPSTSLWLLLENEGAISGRSIADAEYTTEDFNPAVGFEMNTEGRRLFHKVTSMNVGRRLAIVLEGEVQSSPVIRSAIDGRGVITGSFTPEEVSALVLVLKAGELPSRLTLESEETIGR